MDNGRSRVIWCILLLVLLQDTSAALLGQQSFQVTGQGQTVTGLGGANFGVSADATVDIQGYVVAVGSDPAFVTIEDLTISGTSAESENADFVVGEIFNEGFTLGVVLDAQAPFEGNVIPAGIGISLANFEVRSVLVVPDGSTETTGFLFVDEVLNQPPASNIMVQGGQSIGVNQGLVLVDAPAALTILPPPPATLTIEGASSNASSEGCARILMDNSGGGAQGFVLSIGHDDSVLELIGIDISNTVTEEVGAEFLVVSLEGSGGTIGVVLDFEAPFDGHEIAPGENQHIANYCYRVMNPPIVTDGDPIPPAEVTDLTFVDHVFGDPLLANLVVIGGLSINPILNDGQFTIDPIVVPSENTVFYADAFFDEEVGNYPIPDATGRLHFSYEEPDGNIQGFTLTLCYDCHLTIDPASWDYEGSIVEEVGVEYLAVQVDDLPADGDGCELIVGILLDALPPFDGQTLPQTVLPLLIGGLDVTIDSDAPCEVPLPIEFCSGINGTGSVSLYNNVVIDFQSVQNFEMNGTEIIVQPIEIFQRGDCNGDDKVDLADIATAIAAQFMGYGIDCSDACDFNDDGILNLADSVFGLNYLFQYGAVPPSPGAYDDGPDPTEDSLPVCESNDTVC
ncbi:MAG: hypothetical protein VX764_07970 [Planctomycetota bacterium]|nr:hypothetical protein [Planctomycetota bacterium]